MGQIGENLDNAVLSLKEDTTLDSRKGGDWGRKGFLWQE